MLLGLIRPDSGVVLGYFYFLEYVLLIIPGINTIYPFLPGGATAGLTSFTFITNAVTEHTASDGPTLLPAPAAALVLIGYASITAGFATLAPLRRDLT